MTKLTIISATFLVLSGAFYGYLFTTVPSSSEIASMTSNAKALKKDLNKQEEQYKDLTKWTKDSGEINFKILDLSYASSFPRGSFVTDIKHLRGGKSQITVRANDPGLSSDIMNDLSKKFANVELLSIKSPGKEEQLSTFEIAFEIK